MTGTRPTGGVVNPDRFDDLARSLASGTLSRRGTLKAFALGAAASLFPWFADDAEAAGCGGQCAKRNWCEDRTHTCGPAGRNGKCFVKKFGGKNICAQIARQAETCADCAEPDCPNCICVHAAGGGDKCNNGVSGFDFLCVRKV
jgi:hypothetical protein